MQPDFDQVFEGFEEIAQRMFLRDGHHEFIIAVCDRGELDTYQLQFDDDTTKQTAYALLTRRYHGEATFYVQVCEAWMVKLSNALDDVIGQLQPSRHPDRIEVLEVFGAHRGGRRRVTTWEIKRDPLRLEKLDMEPGVRGAGAWDRMLLGVDVEMMRFDDSGRMRLP